MALIRVALMLLTLASASLLSSAQSTGTPEPRPVLRVEAGQHAAPVRRMSVSPARNLLVTASDDKTARVWELSSGQLKLILRPPIGAGEIGRMYGAAIHPRLPLVAIGGTTAEAGKRGSIYLFSLDSGEIERVIDAGVGDIKKLAWSVDGAMLLAGFSEPGGIRAFSIDGRPLYAEATEGPVQSLAIGAHGLVAATDLGGRIVLLKASGEQLTHSTALTVKPLEPVGVAISPDERELVVGYANYLVPANVMEATTGRIVRQLKPQGQQQGRFNVVAWSGDGKTIAVAGSASRVESRYSRYPVWLFSAGQESAERVVDVAGNSVLDLADTGAGRFAYSSFDGSWGVIGTQPVVRVGSNVNDLRGAGNLVGSEDLQRVGWTFDLGGERASFDLKLRSVGAVGAGLAPALTRRSFLDSPLEAGFGAQGPANLRSSVEFNGTRVQFSGVELGSSGTYLRNSRDTIIGSTKALYRFDGNGKQLWRLPTAAEVDAVVASADGKLIVTAMSDGLIQWRRASDGAELLSLLVTRDKRWVIWTPEGYFDASAGADTLVGWVVNRGRGESAELFSLGRFRDRYQRPDVIDQVLQKLDTQAAIAEAPPSMRVALLASEGDLSAVVAAPAPAHEPAPAPALPTAPLPPPQVAAVAPSAASAPSSVPAAAPRESEFPPSLIAVAARTLQSVDSTLEIPFALNGRSADLPSQIKIELRVDGRPMTATSVDLPPRLDGKSVGRVTVKLEGGAGKSIVLLARNTAGFSEPLQFQIAAPPPPPTPVVAAKPEVKTEARPSSGAASASAGASVATESLSPPPPVKTAPKPPESAPARRSALPKLYLLVVGISEYERPAYRLGLPAKDAADFTRVMTSQRGKSYSEVVPRVLTNASASRQAILDGLKWLSDVVGPDDVGMLFIAGHGVSEQGGQYYFMSYDAHFEQVQKTAVPERDIRDALRRIRGRAIFFVDTCFAGNVIGDPRTSSRELSRLANSLASAENGVIVFAASSGRQESEESTEWGNGAFTKALVDGLSGGADLNHAGRITFKGLDFFVSEEVRKLTKGRQTPVTIMPVGIPDFDIASQT